MENNTTNQYSVNPEKLYFQNKGQNLLKKVVAPKYQIRMYLEVRGNLLNRHSEILVNSNLPFMSWNYQNISEKDFLKNLKEFVKLPIYEDFVVRNRKQANKHSAWGDTTFRTKAVDFDKISFSWGENLSNEIDEDFKTKFVSKVMDILDSQRYATPQEEIDFKKYYDLLEEVDNLTRQGKAKCKYSWCYSPSTKDETKQILLEKEEFNNKLKSIETELTNLKEKYDYLNLPRFDYIEDEEENPYEQDYEEDYDDYDEDDE